MYKRDHCNCDNCDTVIDIEKETVKRTCSLTGKDVPMMGCCKDFIPKKINIDPSAIINNNYEFNPTGYSHI